MSDNFKALVVNQEGENFTREVKSIEKSFLKHCSNSLMAVGLSH
jgi:alcohol dehydrogenase/acrylyl-CoA reductase (NADPH)